MTASARPSASASGCSAARPCTSRSPPRSSTKCVSSGRSARTSARPSSTCCATAKWISPTSSASPAGKTFFWRGKYGWDLNSRETLDTQLGVFEGFQPKLSETSRSSEVLFLANIQPDLQRDVRAQLPDAKFVALDSMNLWIETARDSLVKAIAECRLPDPQRLRAAPAHRQASLVAAAREILSWSPPHPRVIVAKQGEYGAALVTAGGFFSLPAYPAGVGRRPHRRGRHVRGRLRRVHRRARRRGDHRRAAAPGDGPRDRARVVQRRRVRHPAHRAPHGERRSSRACDNCASSPSSPPRCSSAAAPLVLDRSGASSAASLHRWSTASQRPVHVIRPRADGSTIGCGVDAWTFIWLMVILKIPIVGLFMIVRWAVRQATEAAAERGRRHRLAAASPSSHHPRSRLPRAPRRGPSRHAAPALRRAFDRRRPRAPRSR